MAEIRTRALCEALHVTPKTVRSWRESGMPYSLRKHTFWYDVEAVEAWLAQCGKLAPRGDGDGADALRTVGEVAHQFAVSARTIRDWQNDPMFPGRAGHYPIREIETWLAQRPGQRRVTKDPEFEAAELELMDRRIREKDLKIAKLQGELMPITMAVEIAGHLVVQASAIFDEFPYRVLSEFPDAAADVRSRILATATRIVEDCKRSLRATPSQLNVAGKDKN